MVYLRFCASPFKLIGCLNFVSFPFGKTKPRVPIDRSSLIYIYIYIWSLLLSQVKVGAAGSPRTPAGPDPDHAVVAPAVFFLVRGPSSSRRPRPPRFVAAAAKQQPRRRPVVLLVPATLPAAGEVAGLARVSQGVDRLGPAQGLRAVEHRPRPCRHTFSAQATGPSSLRHCSARQQ